jgi:hypothetical protein
MIRAEAEMVSLAHALDSIHTLMEDAICNPIMFETYYERATALAEAEGSRFPNHERQMEMTMRAFDNLGLVNPA